MTLVCVIICIIKIDCSSLETQNRTGTIVRGVETGAAVLVYHQLPMKFLPISRGIELTLLRQFPSESEELEEKRAESIYFSTCQPSKILQHA